MCWIPGKQQVTHPLFCLALGATSEDDSATPPEGNTIDAKVKRLKGELRVSRPPGPDHPVWENFSVYLNKALKCYAICLLCDRAKQYRHVELKFSNERITQIPPPSKHKP